MSLRNLVLFLLFGGLLFGAYSLYHSQTSKPLRADMIAVDTALISRLRIHPKDGQARVIELQREADEWIVSNGQLHLRALTPPVEALLRNLVQITTVDVAAHDEPSWLDYGLATGQAVRVEVYEQGRLTEDFWIGQTSTQKPDGLAYIRVHNEPEVYTVQGLETYPFFQEFPIYRSKTLLALPAEEAIDSFSFQYPDTTFTFVRQGQEWQIDGKPIADAGPIRNYLANLRNVHADIYVDDFDHNLAADKKYCSLLLYLPQSEQPILVHAYRDTLREHPFILQSSQNPGSWFGSDSSGIYSRLFWGMPALQALEQ